MVSSALFSLGLFAASSLVPGALAAKTVSPTAPVQGTVYKEGSNCHIAWLGDTSSTTTWQGMSIELMTGQNLNMVQLAIVASNQDGTKDGSFDHLCPEVSINAPIYFYRFSSGGSAGNPNYSARFTIAGADGSTVPAPQTDSNGVQWGTGEIVSGSHRGSTTTSPTSTKSATWTTVTTGTATATGSWTTSSPIAGSGSGSGLNRWGKTVTVTQTVAAAAGTVTSTVWPGVPQTVTIWGAAVTATVTQTVTAAAATVTVASPFIPSTVTVNAAPVTVTVTAGGNARMVTVTTSSTSTATNPTMTGKASKNASSAAITLDLRLISVVGIIAATMTVML